ncbi:MAG: methionine--tRNA ligase [Candidatus Sumerlaeia bacterium]|nr:methionine--tRNA ligase [Candidatus Sumerlaeia bacterium]
METILIGVAWPYANGEQHLGHIAGAYLPPDIFARYNRMAGNRVLMVSGSDAHGTPIVVSADAEKVTPKEIVERYHPKFIESYLKLGITFDLFTHTDTQNHWDVTHDFFLTHYNKGFIYKDEQRQVFDPVANMFLPDRFVEGTCPRCGFTDARGDQCDNCGNLHDATELKNPRSKISGTTDLEIRPTEHFFLDLGKLNDELLSWMSTDKEHWRANVRNVTLSKLEAKDLRGRPITRDMTWGINIPLEGFDSKRIYVWYDAVIGYFSASKEWSAITGQPEAWREFWDTSVNPKARASYFIGKDNIPFHAIIWPGMLMAYGGLNLPYDVPSNEYLQMKGRKFSKSRGGSIRILNVLERYQPDALRFALTSLAPETNDVEFTWEDFVERVNNELAKNWGNLVNRMLSFAFKRFEGCVPMVDAGIEAPVPFEFNAEEAFREVGELYAQSKFRQALKRILELSSVMNNYVTVTEPFKVIKENEPLARVYVYNTLQAIANLNLLWAPILPHTAQKVHELLGFSGQLFGNQYTEVIEDARGPHLVLRYDHTGAVGTWKPVVLPQGQALQTPAPVIQMLELEKVLEAEGVKEEA